MRVVDVTRWEPADEEPLGTKPKQWLRRPSGGLWLWKESTLQRDGRHGAFRKGDDWSEVVAGSLGRRLGVPVANVELAVRGEQFGVISENVLTPPNEVLVHGNELLGEIGVGAAGRRDRAGYTVDAVAMAIAGVEPPGPSDELPDAFDWFTGYLVLDALVGNTDRHEDNWAIIRSPSGRRLAPSFDHASCLGFQLSDAERVERLETADANRTVAAYVAAARTKFHGRPSPVDAVLQAMSKCDPAVREHWSSVVTSAPALADLAAEIPVERMSIPARRFAEAVYEANRASLSYALRTMAP